MTRYARVCSVLLAILGTASVAMPFLAGAAGAESSTPKFHISRKIEGSQSTGTNVSQQRIQPDQTSTTTQSTTTQMKPDVNLSEMPSLRTSELSAKNSATQSKTKTVVQMPSPNSLQESKSVSRPIEGESTLNAYDRIPMLPSEEARMGLPRARYLVNRKIAGPQNKTSEAAYQPVNYKPSMTPALSASKSKRIDPDQTGFSVVPEVSKSSPKSLMTQPAVKSHQLATNTASSKSLSKPAVSNTRETVSTPQVVNNQPLPADAKKQALKALDKASALGERGKMKEAIVEYQKALYFNPALPDARVGLSAAYGSMGQWSRAVEELNLALAHESDFAQRFNWVQAHYNLSAAHCMQGQGQQAREAFHVVEKNNHPMLGNLSKLLESKCQ